MFKFIVEFYLVFKFNTNILFTNIFLTNKIIFQESLREDYLRQKYIQRQKKLMESKKPKNADNHLETRFNYYTTFLPKLRQTDVKKYGALYDDEEEKSGKKEETKTKEEKRSEKSRKKKREKKLNKKKIINTIHEESSNEPSEIIEPQPGPSSLLNPTSKQEKRKKGSELMSCSDDERGKQKQARIEEWIRGELRREEELTKVRERILSPELSLITGFKRKNNMAYSSCSEDENVHGPKLLCRPDGSFCSNSSSNSSNSSYSNPDHGVMSSSKMRCPSTSPVIEESSCVMSQSNKSNSHNPHSVGSASAISPSTSTSFVPSVGVLKSSSPSHGDMSKNSRSPSSTSSGSDTPAMTSDTDSEQVWKQWILPPSTIAIAGGDISKSSASTGSTGSDTPTITSYTDNEQVEEQWILSPSTRAIPGGDISKSSASTGSTGSTSGVWTDDCL